MIFVCVECVCSLFVGDTLHIIVNSIELNGKINGTKCKTNQIKSSTKIRKIVHIFESCRFVSAYVCLRILAIFMKKQHTQQKIEWKYVTNQNHSNRIFISQSLFDVWPFASIHFCILLAHITYSCNSSNVEKVLFTTHLWFNHDSNRPSRAL